MFYYADTADKNAILENFKVRLYPVEKLNRVTDNLYRWDSFDKYDKIDVDSSIVFCDNQDNLLNTLQDNFINWVTNQALPQDKAEFIITFNAFEYTAIFINHWIYQIREKREYITHILNGECILRDIGSYFF